MNLIAEIGNTNTKLALFDHRELKQVWKAKDTDSFWEEVADYRIEKAILAGSGNINVEWWEKINANKKIVFERELLKNMKYAYTSPNTLGADRLINAWYAHSIYPNLDNLVIDTGTCITFTLIDKNSRLIGGSISPGLALRIQSMHDYTDKLPLIELTENLNPALIGQDTISNLESGVLLGTLFEIEKRIEAYRENNPNLNIIMTGGSAHFFENKLNYKIFADDHFTLKGLNELLLANE